MRRGCDGGGLEERGGGVRRQERGDLRQRGQGGRLSGAFPENLSGVFPENRGIGQSLSGEVRRKGAKHKIVR